jgi:hypothetical protein
MVIIEREVGNITEILSDPRYIQQCTAVCTIPSTTNTALRFARLYIRQFSDAYQEPIHS